MVNWSVSRKRLALALTRGGGLRERPKDLSSRLAVGDKSGAFFFKKKRKLRPSAGTFLFRSQNPFFVSFYVQGGDAGNLTPRLSVCIDE